jgi:hypothetical protein
MQCRVGRERDRGYHPRGCHGGSYLGAGAGVAARPPAPRRPAPRPRPKPNRMDEVGVTRTVGSDYLVLRCALGRDGEPCHERAIRPHGDRKAVDTQARVTAADGAEDEIGIARSNELPRSRISDAYLDRPAHLGHRRQLRIQSRQRRSWNDRDCGLGSGARRGPARCNEHQAASEAVNSPNSHNVLS